MSLFAHHDADAGFEILSGQAAVREDAVDIEADAALSLGEAPAEAVNRGIELRFGIEIGLYRFRPLLWDERVARWNINYRLKYHALSASYVLFNEREQEYETFASIRDAMDALSDIDVTLPVAAPPVGDGGYRVSMRVVLDRESLPSPLRLLTRVSPSWDLDSAWTQWTAGN